MQFGESGQFWSIAFRQEIDGIPVEGAWVFFHVSHGNLVQFGVDRTIPVSARPKAPAALLGAAQGKSSIASWIGGLREEDEFAENGTLLPSRTPRVFATFVRIL